MTVIKVVKNKIFQKNVTSHETKWTLLFLSFSLPQHSRFKWAGKHILTDKHSKPLAAAIVRVSPDRARAEPCRNCRDR